MTSDQQKETLGYFNLHAEDWNKQALSRDARTVNTIMQRNAYVVDVIRKLGSIKRTLDVGCGTGDLVCDIARLGVDATGIDFAERMISISVAKAKEGNLRNAHFVRTSFFDYDRQGAAYDLVSANGLIEYFSMNELDFFLKLAFEIIQPSGSLLVESRNRLFNIFSVNWFTGEELKAGAEKMLIQEAIAIAAGVDIKSLSAMETPPLQPDNFKHANSGIDVDTRFQYSPAQLIKILIAHGFEAVEICPIHVHGVPPVFKKKFPEVHAQISTLLQRYAAQNISLLPFASSYMLRAKKADK